VAEAAVEAGAHMVNDVSGGSLDPDMYSTVAKLGVPYVLMHMRGDPTTMQVRFFSSSSLFCSQFSAWKLTSQKG
jgi:dihydropteroate synthase